MGKEKLTRTSYKNDIILIDGLGLSGKTIIERILTCFPDVELHLELENIDSLFELYENGNLDYDGLKGQFNIMMDRAIFNLNLGRYISIRPSDFPSLYTYPYPLKYIKRLFIKDKVFKNKNIRDIIRRKIDSNQSILQIPIHCAIKNANLLYGIFGERMKIIHIVRNPIDWMSGMIKYDIFSRIGVDPTTVDFFVEKHNAPFSVLNWIDEYKEYSNIERCLKYYIEINTSNYNSYMDLPDVIKKNILILDFDGIIINPINICNKIRGFIGKKYTYRVNKVLKKENCPREIDYKKRLAYRNELLNIPHKFLVEESEDVYEKMRAYGK